MQFKEEKKENYFNIIISLLSFKFQCDLPENTRTDVQGYKGHLSAGNLGFDYL